MNLFHFICLEQNIHDLLMSNLSIFSCCVLFFYKTENKKKDSHRKHLFEIILLQK